MEREKKRVILGLPFATATRIFSKKLPVRRGLQVNRWVLHMASKHDRTPAPSSIIMATTLCHCFKTLLVRGRRDLICWSSREEEYRIIVPRILSIGPYRSTLSLNDNKLLLTYLMKKLQAVGLRRLGRSNASPVWSRHKQTHKIRQARLCMLYDMQIRSYRKLT
jgi:hypothetical protein